MKKIYVLYHAMCSDGFSSAWAFWKRFGDEAQYIAVTHGNLPPEMNPASQVFIVDFSYKREVLLALRDRHEDLVLLDHHVTAQADLEGLDFAQFDMTRSGAVLAWNYCHPGAAVPRLLSYVQDRDLWQFALPHSREVDAMTGLTPKDFSDWSALADKVESDFDNLVAMGSVVLANNREFVENACTHARLVDLAGCQVPCVNTPLLHSEIGNELLARFPQSPFSVTWFQEADGHFKVSFRSRGDFDVAELARSFGGGGHRAAAGCRFNEVP